MGMEFGYVDAQHRPQHCTPRRTKINDRHLLNNVYSSCRQRVVAASGLSGYLFNCLGRRSETKDYGLRTVQRSCVSDLTSHPPPLESIAGAVWQPDPLGSRLLQRVLDRVPGRLSFLGNLCPFHHPLQGPNTHKQLQLPSSEWAQSVVGFLL